MDRDWSPLIPTNSLLLPPPLSANSKDFSQVVSLGHWVNSNVIKQDRGQKEVEICGEGK